MSSKAMQFRGCGPTTILLSSKQAYERTCKPHDNMQGFFSLSLQQQQRHPRDQLPRLPARERAKGERGVTSANVCPARAADSSQSCP